MSGNIVPRADLQGNLGTGSKRWNKVYAKSTPIYYDTKALMKADLNLTPGLTAFIKGELEVNDGYTALFHIREAIQEETYDDETLIQLTNGNVAELLTGGQGGGASYQGQQEIAEAIQEAALYVMVHAPLVFPNVAAMKQIDLVEGTTVITKGKLIAMDGSGAFYSVRAAGSGETYDDDNLVLLNNGNVAQKMDLGAASYAGQQEIAAAINNLSLSMMQRGVQFFSNVDTMVAADLAPGATAATKGYHTINDGGGAFYNIRAKQSGDVEDGGSIIFLDNDNVAELLSMGGPS